MRTGLFGGTFNPVHTGHIKVSGEIKETFGFDRMIIIPSAIPPHKGGMDIADAEYRFEMTRNAFRDKSGYIVSDIEIKRQGPSYTVDTVRHFTKNLKTGDEFYLIVGMDAFLEIDTWMSYKELFKQVPMVVISRPGYGAGEGHRRNEAPHDMMGDFITKKISDGYTFSMSGQCFEHDRLQPVYPVHITPVDISATDIREKIRQGTPISGLVPEAVEAYIIKKGLYQ